MKHVHHDMIVEWAADPSREVEFLVEEPYFESSSWMTVKRPAWNPKEKYRFKPEAPKYIVVNGVNVPEPVREKLEYECTYWLASTTEGEPFQIRAKILADTLMNFWLSLGLIHLTREAAQTHIDAMLLPSRTDK